MRTKKTVNKKPTDKELDRLWVKACRARDGNMCVYTREIHPGRPAITEGLNVHHILRKATHRMRWELDNGITISQGTHFYVAHGPGVRAKQFEQWALSRLSSRAHAHLLLFQNMIGGLDKFALKLYLEKQIKTFEARK